MATDAMTRGISCLCGDAAQDVLLDSVSDPSSLNLCHCIDCRAITGMLYSSYYFLQPPGPDLDRLQKYQQSDCVSRYFCRTCGAHVFARLEATGKTLVAAGLLENPPPVRLIQHWKAEDTRDGGLSSFLPGDSKETTSACWLDVVQNISNERADENHKLEEEDHGFHRLQARCHCGGVEFYITPPDSNSAKPWSPWPDLIVPYHLASAKNIEDVKWWLRNGNTKYLVGTCACRSCRLASGFSIQSWAFIPRSNIVFGDGKPVVYGSGTMQQYESRPGVYREFCSRCGATVFWHCQERPDVVDVSTGLLRARSGAKAEEWLEWATERVSFKEMALDQEFIERLEVGLRNWDASKKRPNT